MTEEEMKAFIGYDKLTKEDLWEALRRGMRFDEYRDCLFCYEDICEIIHPGKREEYRKIQHQNAKDKMMQSFRALCPFETGVPLSGQAFDELVKEGKIAMESQSVPDDRCMITGQREIFTVRVL